MNLQPINPPTPEFFFRCSACNALCGSRTGYADLDDVPFAAFYCAECANQKRSQP